MRLRGSDLRRQRSAMFGSFRRATIYADPFLSFSRPNFSIRVDSQESISSESEKESLSLATNYESPDVEGHDSVARESRQRVSVGGWRPMAVSSMEQKIAAVCT